MMYPTTKTRSRKNRHSNANKAVCVIVTAALGRGVQAGCQSGLMWITSNEKDLESLKKEGTALIRLLEAMAPPGSPYNNSVVSLAKEILEIVRRQK
ncbi:serine/threonine-protein kinase ULK4-like [Sarcophilus harrisii]